MLYAIGALGILGVLGYIAVERLKATAASLGQQLGQQLTNGVGMTTVTVTPSSPSALGQFGLKAADTLVLNLYAAPAGYVWKFAVGVGLTVGATTPTSATIAVSPGAPSTPISFYANLVKSGATVAPMATFTGTVLVGA